MSDFCLAIYIPRLIERMSDDFVKTSTFKTFWQAFEFGKLIELMDYKGLKEMRQPLASLEAFLAAGIQWHRPSMRELKRLIAYNNYHQNLGFHKYEGFNKKFRTTAVKSDYGYQICTSELERKALVHTYRCVLA
ncbi:hypothetical protein B0O99DRAFT_690044 [Bisporella sp. PMI_857]|nr:hypothetical protein B0O99DRAFT_690044 [Bisporella sp. PMI_857]